MLGIGLAPPADQEALADRSRLVDLELRHRRLADAARGLRDERERHHRDARQVFARLLVRDVDELIESPLGRELRQRRLDVDPRVAGADVERPRRRRWQARQVVAVDQQAPDLFERHQPDEVLDVHSAVAKCAALPVGLGDLGLEGDYALEARGYVYEAGFTS